MASDQTLQQLNAENHMEQPATFKSHKALFLNTLAFTVCFSAWMLNGVLVTFLASDQVYDWGPVEIGWLMGTPVLTGSIFRLPAGMLTDKYGGKPVYGSLLLFCAIPMYLLSYAVQRRIRDGGCELLHRHRLMHNVIQMMMREETPEAVKSF